MTRPPSEAPNDGSIAADSTVEISDNGDSKGTFTATNGTCKQCSAAASAQGGRIPTRDEWHRMRLDYNGLPGVSPNWTWSSTTWGIAYMYGIQTETGAEMALEYVLGNSRADGFGIRAK